MRNVVLGIVALMGTALPASSQSAKTVTGPWTLTGTLVMCTDMQVPVKPDVRLTVAGLHSPDYRFATATGTLVIKRFPDDGLQVGQRYVTARLREPKAFSRAVPGGDVRVSGIVTIKAVDAVNALADIDVACDAVEIGDFLQPFSEIVLPETAGAMLAPDFSDRGQVLFGTDNRTAFGFGDTLSIDRGTVHGVVAGARYAIYRDKHNGLPLVYVGEVVVMAPGEQSSRVAVIKANDAIESGDLVVPRRQPN